MLIIDEVDGLALELAQASLAPEAIREHNQKPQAVILTSSNAVATWEQVIF